MNKITLALVLLLVLVLGNFAEASMKFGKLRALPRRGEDDEDDGGDGDDDPEDENEEDREVDYEVKDDEVEIESESESEDEDSRDKAEIKIVTGENGSLRIRVKWYHKADDSEEAFDFKVRFNEIVEFLETGAPSSGFDDTDTVVQHYVLGLDSNGWVPASTSEGPNGETIFTFQTGDGVFRVDIIITSSLTELESGTTLAPNELKIDVYINDFPYTGDGSFLALLGKVQSKFEAEDDDDVESDEEGTSLEGAASFTWDTTVLADGVEVNVITTSFADEETDDDYEGGDDEDESEGESEAETGGKDDDEDGGDGEDDEDDDDDRPEVATGFAWTFDTNAQPASIYWDPKITTVGVEPDSAATASVALIAVVAALLIAF